MALTAQTPQTASAYNAKNQVTSWDYDSKGNLVDFGGGSSSPSFAYDIDNRMKSATVNGTATQYQYDGDGRRVQKIGTSSSTVFVYDAFGDVAEEYSTQSSTSGSTSYVAVDALGSTRLMEPSTGGVGSAFDYEPFGGELFVGTNGRTTAQGFESAPVATIPKFTGKERDSESGGVHF